jgi:hypothetical protein
VNELGLPAVHGTGAGAVAIIVLLVLVLEHQLLGLVRSTLTRARKAALLVLVGPLLPVFVAVAVQRIIDIASKHP